ncbi:MAG: galactose-1-phosphate uridylyltransferase [Fimbriimonadales bacterium]
MSELRWHPFHQDWVITATHRQDRTFFPPDDYCPLCPTKAGGFPTEAPRETYDVVVLENKFPSLKTPPTDPAVVGGELLLVRPSVGVCEVVCYTSDHDATIADLPARQIKKLVRVWRDRYIDLKSRPGVEYVFIFENKGREIGVTLTHPHGQIYAYPYVPQVIQTRHQAERTHLGMHGRTLAADWLRDEAEDGRRIVFDYKNWTAVVPFFARYPFEVHLVPKADTPDLESMNDEMLNGLAEGLKELTARYDKLFSFSLPYVMSIFQYSAEHTRLIVEFTPPYRTKDKLKYLAGSEAGCGAFINDTLPEETAAQLRAL